MTFQIETRVRQIIRRLGPLSAFRQLIAENDAAIRQPELGNGRALASARTAIYTELVRHWASEQRQVVGYRRPFAVVALGGTGRAELAPYSDLDFAFLFDDTLEGNSFLLELQRQVLHSTQFEDRYGFGFQPLPFNLDEAPRLTGKQLNSFLDMRPVFDPDGLSGQFRERVRATFDPFEHFLHVRGFWRDHLAQAAGEFERVDRFDIKNEGLRVFLAGIWTLAGARFIHSHEVYPLLEDSRDLAAYDFLMRLRALVHSRRGPTMHGAADGSHEQDLMRFDDFTAFDDLLPAGADERRRFDVGIEVRARLLAARRRVAQFTKGVIERELKNGREVSPGSRVIYGVGGLYHQSTVPLRTPQEKSRAALSLLLASQRYGVPIDAAELQTTFRNAGDWLVLVPEVSALFYETRGSLAESFVFLSQFDGAQERLFPGYARFEASCDSRVLTERKELRGALERRKLAYLEERVREGQEKLGGAVSAGSSSLDNGGAVSVAIEAALLDSDQLAAVKLALKTKRLPVTEDDVVALSDAALPWRERLCTGMSEIPLEDYYEPYQRLAGFTPETIRLAEFLVANRRAFKESTEHGINDPLQVERFDALCRHDEGWVRSLFVFTCADRGEWQGEAAEPTRWFNIRELYTKAMARFGKGLDIASSLERAGYAPEELAILKDFGADFFEGRYRTYANRFGSHLVRLTEAGGEEAGPKVSVVRDGTSIILGVASRDFRGLAACICGALWREHIQVRQAHLFSAMHQGLVLDFFHVAPGGPPLGMEVTERIEAAIRERRHIADSDEATLPRVEVRSTLQEWRPGLYRLRCDTAPGDAGVVYSLTYRVFRYLRGNIFGLVAFAAQGETYLSIYLSLPQGMTFAEAQEIVSRHLG
ncbi:MAG: hypothetical protein JNK85_03200 [Verrucomicrobiales bacterium]|nr:hypothetical protein [Verrucomicrobiales bacterium]